jgi:16S rRNA (guanine527-N7)-methyltransferase
MTSLERARVKLANTCKKEKTFNDLLLEWNKKINLVSRKKTGVTDLTEESKLFSMRLILKMGLTYDLGTGGGFPGVVIAIHHPENLTLVDSIQKVNAVKDIVKN